MNYWVQLGSNGKYDETDRGRSGSGNSAMEAILRGKSTVREGFEPSVPF